MNTSPELFVLTRVIDDRDPHWGKHMTVFGTKEQISKVVDVSKGVVPYGWRLLRGKKARRFLKWSMEQEALWRREQELKRKAGGLN